MNRRVFFRSTVAGAAALQRDHGNGRSAVDGALESAADLMSSLYRDGCVLA